MAPERDTAARNSRQFRAKLLGAAAAAAAAARTLTSPPLSRASLPSPSRRRHPAYLM